MNVKISIFYMSSDMELDKYQNVYSPHLGIYVYC